ncbi:MAG: hypothetical protein MRJ92_12775 [Nitrospira sp.]|nr:hypothetical protein [Nitrospira sp.]
MATEWEELTHLKSPAQLCRGTDAFSRAIEQSLAGPPDRAALQAHAAQHDWGARVSNLLKALGVPAGSPAPTLRATGECEHCRRQ